MERSPLDGCSILVVEDEPMVAMGIELELVQCGADVTIATTVQEASQLVDEQFSLAVVDHGLTDGTGSEIYALLRELGVPFIIHTGHDIPIDDRCGGTLVSKPAMDGKLRAVAEELVAAEMTKKQFKLDMGSPQ